MIYQFKKDTPHKIKRLDAQKVGNVLDAARFNNGGVLLPEKIVDIARSPDSPLHPAFTWDDTEAAEKYRTEVEAENLVRAVVTIVDEDTEGEPAYFPIKVTAHSNGNGVKAFQHADVIKRDDSEFARALRTAQIDLEGAEISLQQLLRQAPPSLKEELFVIGKHVVYAKSLLQKSTAFNESQLEELEEERVLIGTATA